MESTKLTQLVYPELITTEKLKVDGSNFFTWKSKIKLVFCELGITYVLKDPKPAEPTDDSSKEKLESLDKWVSDDRRCRFAMLFAMENDLFQLCNRHTTAKSIMDYLTLMYVSTSLTTRMILFSKYTEHKMSEETPINDHLMEMGLMAYQLKKAGLPISQDMQVVLLMNSLPDSWDTENCERLKRGRNLPRRSRGITRVVLRAGVIHVGSAAMPKPIVLITDK
ncbi:hypothetical protein NE237_004468 [Protea cynaroides]|uniref:Uncharacterized protein n=1 Tax=Protea cynaroides TaxID=273540 RepID=A0A9Q0QTQ6_9MAGN|nr:hypothetical protein NE237_004468 [Protea cynaroides]